MRKYWYSIIIFICFSVSCFFLKDNFFNNEHIEESYVVDSIGRKVILKLPIERAVVTNGHNINLVTAIGNSIDKIVGVDSYYDYMAYGNRFKDENIVGETQKELNYERIISLNPDVLIISDNGCWREAEKNLEPFGIKVIVLNAYYTGDFRENCQLVGVLFGYKKEAEEIINYFESKLKYINDQLENVPKRKLYIEYRNPCTTIVPGSTYSEMLEYAEAKNIFDDADNTYIDSEAVIIRNPDYIIKISEGTERGIFIPPSYEEFLRRKDKITCRPGWDMINAVRNDRILLMSNYAFGGACELVGTMYIAKFLYPEYLPDLHPEEVLKTWVTKYNKLPYREGHTYPKFKMTD